MHVWCYIFEALCPEATIGRNCSAWMLCCHSKPLNCHNQHKATRRWAQPKRYVADTIVLLVAYSLSSNNSNSVLRLCAPLPIDRSQANKNWFANSDAPGAAVLSGSTPPATGLPEDLWSAYWQAERDFALGTNNTGQPVEPAQFYRLQPAFQVPKGSQDSE